MKRRKKTNRSERGTPSLQSAISEWRKAGKREGDQKGKKRRGGFGPERLEGRRVWAIGRTG